MVDPRWTEKDLGKINTLDKREWILYVDSRQAREGIDCDQKEQRPKTIFLLWLIHIMRDLARQDWDDRVCTQSPSEHPQPTTQDATAMILLTSFV